MKDIIMKLNEAKQEEYRVSFLDVADSDGIPMTVTILVDKQYSKMFEKFLEDQQDNIFSHAEGGNVEY
jgi:hypothetical protein